MVDEVEAFQRAGRRRRRIKLLLLFTVILSPVIGVGWLIFSRQGRIDDRAAAASRAEQLSPRESAELQTLVRSATSAIGKNSQGLVTAAAPGSLDQVQQGGGPCGLGKRDMRAAFYAPGDPVKPLAMQRSARLLTDVEEQLANHTATKSDLESIRQLVEDPGVELFVVIRDRKDPIALDGSFVAGHVSASAFLYSYGDRRIVCTGGVAVTSSSTIQFSYQGAITGVSNKYTSAHEAVVADLDEQVRAAAIANLRETRVD